MSFALLTRAGQILRLRETAFAALARYPLEVSRITLIHHGFNTTFRVETADGGRYALRINVNSSRTLANIETELAWTAALAADTSLHVPTPQLNNDGQAITMVYSPVMQRELPTALFGWLRGQNLEAGKDYEVKGARTDLGVGRMLLSGDAVAAIMSNGEFRALPADESSRLKIGEVFARIPNFITMAHPRLERDKINRLRSQLKAFLADNDDGSAFARATGFSGIVDVDDAQMRELDPYSAQTRKAMGFVK